MGFRLYDGFSSGFRLQARKKQSPAASLTPATVLDTSVSDALGTRSCDDIQDGEQRETSEAAKKRAIQNFTATQTRSSAKSSSVCFAKLSALSDVSREADVEHEESSPKLRHRSKGSYYRFPAHAPGNAHEETQPEC